MSNSNPFPKAKFKFGLRQVVRTTDGKEGVVTARAEQVDSEPTYMVQIGVRKTGLRSFRESELTRA